MTRIGEWVWAANRFCCFRSSSPISFPIGKYEIRIGLIAWCVKIKCLISCVSFQPRQSCRLTPSSIFSVFNVVIKENSRKHRKVSSLKQKLRAVSVWICKAVNIKYGFQETLLCSSKNSSFRLNPSPLYASGRRLVNFNIYGCGITTDSAHLYGLMFDQRSAYRNLLQYVDLSRSRLTQQSLNTDSELRWDANVHKKLIGPYRQVLAFSRE
jgi:hypothetical protein